MFRNDHVLERIPDTRMSGICPEYARNMPRKCTLLFWYTFRTYFGHISDIVFHRALPPLQLIFTNKYGKLVARISNYGEILSAFPRLTPRTTARLTQPLTQTIPHAIYIKYTHGNAQF